MAVGWLVSADAEGGPDFGWRQRAGRIITLSDSPQRIRIQAPRCSRSSMELFYYFQMPPLLLLSSIPQN